MISTSSLLFSLGLLVSTASAAGPEVKLLRVPDGGIQPQALIDQKGTLHLVYLKGEPKACDVFYCSRPATSSGFASPVRVNSASGSAIAIGTVRGAQLALGRNGIIHIAWNGSDKALANPNGGTPMLYSRSLDAGKSFEPERNLMTSTTHLDGGGSVAADSDGRVYVVWHGHRTKGPQEEIDRAVFLATSRDDGKTFEPERSVNPPETGVCGCCGLKAFARADGSVAILYRSAAATGDRDSELLLSVDHGQTFSAKILGRWHVSTCPMSTQALAQAPAGFYSAWERQGQIYLASVPSQGAAELRPVAAAGAAGNRKHPTFSASGSNRAPLLLAWTEGTGWERGGTLAWECLTVDGQVISTGKADDIPVWSYAAAVADPSGAFTLIF